MKLEVEIDFAEMDKSELLTLITNASLALALIVGKEQYGDTKKAKKPGKTQVANKQKPRGTRDDAGMGSSHSSKRWTDSEVKILKSEYGKSIHEQLAKKLNKTINSLHSKAYTLNLIRKRPKHDILKPSVKGKPPLKKCPVCNENKLEPGEPMCEDCDARFVTE